MYRLLLFLLLISLGACNFMQKAVDGGVEGLSDNEAELEALIAQLSQAAVRSALTEMASDTHYTALREQLGGMTDDLLQRFGDSLNASSQQLVENLMGEQTGLLLDARLTGIREQLRLAVADARGEVLHEDVVRMLQRILQEEARTAMQVLLNTLRQELDSDATAETLSGLRAVLQEQVDSLIQHSLTATGAGYDLAIMPRMEDLLERVQTVGQGTKKDATDLVWLVLLGIASLVVLGGLVYQFVWRYRYKEMLKIMTRNIDQIEEQPIYDRLVQRIRTDMTTRDLEDPLRDILEEQKLLIQPEWEDKDQRVLKLLAEELAKANQGGNQSWEDITKTLFRKAKEIGLADHLNSVLTRGR